MVSAVRPANAQSVIPGGRRALVFRPPARQPALMAAGAAAAALLLAAGLVLRAVGDGITFAAFLSYTAAAVLLTLAAIAAYWSVGLAGLRYEVFDGTLTIVWGLTRQSVPIANIERVVRGRALGMPRVQGINLPGWPCHIGRAGVARLGPVLLYSTHRIPVEILYIVTPRATYGVSPADQPALIGALQAAAETADPSWDLRQEVVRLGPAGWPAWTDRFALAVAALGAAVALAAIAVVFARYTRIPARVIFAFPDKDHPGNKRELLGIPLVALTVLALNTLAALVLHRPLRPIAYTLLLAGVFVEALLLVAAIAAT